MVLQNSSYKCWIIHLTGRDRPYRARQCPGYDPICLLLGAIWSCLLYLGDIVGVNQDGKGSMTLLGWLWEQDGSLQYRLRKVGRLGKTSLLHAIWKVLSNWKKTERLGPICVYTEHWNSGVWDEIGADRRDLTYFWWDPFDSPVLEFCDYQGVCICMFDFKIIWRNLRLVKSWQTQPTFGKKRTSKEGVALSKLPRGPPGPGCTHWVKAGMKLLILDVGACTTSHKQ